MQRIKNSLIKRGITDPNKLDDLAKAALRDAQHARGSRGRFADLLKAEDHFRRHGSDFVAKSISDYERQASEFLTSSPAAGVLQKTRSNADVVRYSQITDEFGVVQPNGVIRTYFKPDPAVHHHPTNLAYYHVQ